MAFLLPNPLLQQRVSPFSFLANNINSNKNVNFHIAQIGNVFGVKFHFSLRKIKFPRNQKGATTKSQEKKDWKFTITIAYNTLGLVLSTAAMCYKNGVDMRSSFFYMIHGDRTQTSETPKQKEKAAQWTAQSFNQLQTCLKSKASSCCRLKWMRWKREREREKTKKKVRI